MAAVIEPEEPIHTVHIDGLVSGTASVRSSELSSI